MTLDALIEQLRTRQDAKLTERKAHDTALDAIRSACVASGNDPTDAEATQVETARAAKAAIDAELTVLSERIAELEGEKVRDEAAARLVRDGVKPAYDGVARVGQEPRTYTRATANGRDAVSFFSDAHNSLEGDFDARSRIERHGREVKVEREGSPDREKRAVSTSGFAGLIVPQYLVDAAALALRNGRPVANTCTNLPLPDQGMSFLVPRGTTGAATAIQASENASAQSTDEVWANLTVNVATIAGQQDVSRQSLERGTPGLDELIYLDLAGAYMANLDTQVITGTGASGQLLGILNTAGINAATAFGVVPSPTSFTLKLAGQVQAIGASGSILQPKVIAMHPRRWGWIQSLVDTAGRPLAVASAVSPWNAMGLISAPGGQSNDGSPTTSDVQFVGVLANGLPVVTDANIPTNVGTNVEDIVLVYDNRQLYLWEQNGGMPQQLRFEQTLGNQLTVKIVVYSYAAFAAGRYPTAVGKIGGLDSTATFGLVAPTF